MSPTFVLRLGGERGARNCDSHVRLNCRTHAAALFLRFLSGGKGMGGGRVTPFHDGETTTTVTADAWCARILGFVFWPRCFVHIQPVGLGHGHTADRNRSYRCSIFDRKRADTSRKVGPLDRKRTDTSRKTRFVIQGPNLEIAGGPILDPL